MLGNDLWFQLVRRSDNVQNRICVVVNGVGSRDLEEHGEHSGNKISLAVCGVVIFQKKRQERAFPIGHPSIRKLRRNSLLVRNSRSIPPRVTGFTIKSRCGCEEDWC